MHTPAPWRVFPPDSNRPSRIAVSTEDGCVDIYDAPLTNETESNAHLIAAAPEMHTVLVKAATYLHETSRQMSSKAHNEALDLWRELEIIIAKAEGRQ